MNQTTNYFKSIKKANCHLHITGALTPTDLRHLSKVTNVDISEFEPLEDHLDFHDPAIWSAAKNVTSTNLGLTEAIKIILKRELEDNVIYVELTINPYGMIRRGMTANGIKESVMEGIKFGESIGIRCKVKFGVNIKDGLASVPTIKNVFCSMPANSRVCIDFNGDETKYKILDFTEAILKLKSEDIPVCIHVGEYMDNIEALEKIISMAPERIAHGIAAIKNEGIINMILENNIVLEMSPLSNIKTGAIKDGEEHPIKKFITRGIPIILGSDDPAFFTTTISLEFEYLADMGVGLEMIEKLNATALKLNI